MLARMAVEAYWFGRHLERAEDTARIVRAHNDALVDLPVGEEFGWSSLVEISGGEPTRFEQPGRHDRHRTSGAPSPHALETAVVKYVLTDRDNPSSILESVARLRDNVRVARPVFPQEVWELCNEMWDRLGLDGPAVGVRDARMQWLAGVVTGCQRINGILHSSMGRDEARILVEMGQTLERAETMCRVLAVRAEGVVPQAKDDAYAQVHQIAILRSLAAYQPFRRAMPTRPDPAAILTFLLHDESFPRTVTACLSQLRDLAKALPRNELLLSTCTDARVHVAGLPVSRLTTEDLRRFLADVLLALSTIHSAVESLLGPDASDVEPRDADAARVAPPGLHSSRSPSPAPRVDRGNIGSMHAARRYRVEHVTAYEYVAPVDQAYNEAHLRPRDAPYQTCLSHALTVDPTAGKTSSYVDPFGNTVTIFVVHGGFDHLVVRARSDVEVRTRPEPPAGPPWESVRMLLDIDRQADARDARRCRAASRLVPTSPALADYAAASFSPGRPLVAALLDLTRRIHEEFAYDPGFTSVTTPVADVLNYRRGVCQDFAHLMIGCLRSLGLAARYVSGYLETVPAAGQEHVVGADASHAWASAYLPGWGWIDVDPTNDQIVSDAYVTTAWGRDYWDVSPLRGSVEGGGGSHRLNVSVEVSRLDDAAVMREPA